jgi:hypothetical protein
MLRLEGFGLFWTYTPNLINLSTLMLQFLRPEAGLTVHELLLVFENATALERLSIHMVHVAGMYIIYRLTDIYDWTGSYMPNNAIAMKLLTFLEYKPGGDGTLGLLMANLRAPALFELHLSLGEGDMQIVNAELCLKRPSTCALAATMRRKTASGHYTPSRRR